MDRGKLLFAAVAVLLALLFARLGLWQLERHRERVEANERRRARLAMPPLPVDSASDLAALPPGEEIGWRVVRLRGRWDYEREIVLHSRSHGGRPAIELLTPLLLEGDVAVLVLRGWLPAPDALHAPIRAARGAAAAAAVRGLALTPDAGAGESAARPFRALVDGEEHLAMRRIDLEAASGELPYSIAKFYVRQLDDRPDAGRLRAMDEPRLTAGPHLSYAFQWFAFALISLVGTAILLVRSG